MSKNIRFQYDPNQQYDIREFYEKFREKLPVWTMITEGNDGETTYDDFCSDTVIRFARVCPQRRVLARESTAAVGNVEEFLSIPVNSKITFCVVKGPGQLSHPQYLEDIVRANTLPFSIRLSHGQDVGFGKSRGGVLVDLLVVEEYTEHYLQGNCLAPDGLIDLPCTACLTREISLSIVTGVKGWNQTQFQDSLRKWEIFVNEKVKFDTEINNPAVKRYKLGDEDIKGVISSGTMFPNDDTYGTPELPPRQGEEADDEYEYLKPDPDWAPPKPPKPKAKDISKREPPTPPASKSDVCFPIIPKTSDAGKSDLNARPPARKPTVYKKEKGPDMSVLDDMNPDLPPGYVTMNQLGSAPVTADDMYSEPTPEFSEEKSHSSASDEVTKLSIKDLGKIMKQLHLDKHVKKFSKDGIDGVIVSQLTTDDLKSDFHFTNVEALKLMTYVKTGHIPK